MIFQELLRSIDFDQVWECLRTRYKVEDKFFASYQNAYQELCVGTPVVSKDSMLLMVAKLNDLHEESEFTYEVTGIRMDSDERYGLHFSPWEEWMGYRVLDKSIVLYGSVEVAAHALHTLTFFGFSNDIVKKNVEKEVAILTERFEESERGTTEYIPAEEVFRKLGFVDRRTEEEKEQKRQYMTSAHEANLVIYKELLAQDE